MHSKMGLLWREVFIKDAIRTATDGFCPTCLLRCARLRVTLALHAPGAVASLSAGDQTLTPACSPQGFSNSTAAVIAKHLLPKLAPFCIGLVCTSATGALGAVPHSPASSSKTDGLFGAPPGWEHPVFANIRPQAVSLGLQKPSLPTQADIKSTQVAYSSLPCGTLRERDASRTGTPSANVCVAATLVDRRFACIGMHPPGLCPANSCKITPLRQALEQDSLLNLTHETSLQAQNSPVIPPVPPENLRPNPNEDRFLQPPPTPAPVSPDSTPPVQPPPTPVPVSPDSTPPVQPPPTPAPVSPDSTPPVQPPPTPQTPTPSNAPTVQVQTIKVTGSTVFGSVQFNPIVQPYEGRSLTLPQLREVADKITQLYLDRGYITSRAILVDQAITQGVVEIRVLEGSLEEIKIEGARRINPSYIRNRVQLGAKTPLNTAQLEDQLRLLRADPLFENVEASLRAGTRLGQSILIVRVVEANPFEGSVGIDNYSPPSVGSERLGLDLLYRNLTGNGDAITTSYYHTTRSGADDLELAYRLPVNSMNGAVQLRTAFTWNKIVDPGFNFFDIQGDSQLYEISFQQPLVRTPREEFSLSLGFSYQNSKALAGPFPISPGANSEGVTTTSVIKFGQDYVRRDVRGAWSLRSLFSFGIDLFGATTNPNPVPDGRFFSWLGQVQRVQVLNTNNLLIVGADIQLTPDSLVPSQQFVIGGGQSLRGYRQNIRAGDNGVRFTIEDRIALERNESGTATFQLAPFFDTGVVWNVSDNPSPLPSQRFLAGLGLGVIWEPLPRLNVRADYGYPLIDLDDRGNNAQDDGFYFSVRYQF